ncbi:MAG: hypothetical protein AAFQ62_01130 [Pseudomonadota bacterium]
MNDERDPTLESLFAAAEEPLQDAAFTESVTGEITGRRRRLIFGRFGVLGMILVLEVLLQSPLQQSLGVAADWLGRPIMTVEGEWLSFALSPVNTAAGILGAVLLAVHLFLRSVLK